MQLNIFTQHTDQLSNAYEKLIHFNFKDARQQFESILKEYPEDKDALLGLSVISSFASFFPQLSKKQLPVFYNLLKHYSFNSWGMGKFKMAAIAYLASNMKAYKIFFLEKDICLADLLLEISSITQAQELLLNYSDTYQSSYLTCRLADTQWLNGEFHESGINYLKALFMQPDDITIDKITNPEIKEAMLHNHIYKLPLYGWLYGVLPLIQINDLSVCKNPAKRAYDYLYLAESYRKKNKLKESIKYRKLLFEEDKKFYEAYFKKLKGELVL